ncbi:hypothetical protein B0O80DRAFT_431977 [Mortierella sp. GBAus27b]|nr:hypothetical protein B0O80DRAFT_431977 [Mortierella sp. GBAus27b]
MALREFGDLTEPAPIVVGGLSLDLSKSSAYSLHLLSIVPGTVFKNKKDPTTVMIQASMRPVNSRVVICFFDARLKAALVKTLVLFEDAGCEVSREYDGMDRGLPIRR